MSNDGGAAPIKRPLRERLFAIFNFNRWFARRSSRRSEKKKAAVVAAAQQESQNVAAAAAAAKSSPKSSTDREDAIVVVRQQLQLQQEQQQQQRNNLTNPYARRHSTDSVLSRPQQQHQQLLINSKPITSPAKIANYESPAQIRLASNPMALTRGNSVALARGNSKSHSVPVSGELQKAPSSLARSSSKSLSKLRDQYEKMMLKLGEMSNSVSLGNSVNFESQVFESELIRKRSQADSEMMDLYFQSSIQPSEWKAAQMGSRIHRNPSTRPISV